MNRRLVHHVSTTTAATPTITDVVDKHRVVVRARRQPRRLRLHLRARPAAVAQEPARQRRRRDHHRRRRRRPQPQLPDQVGLRQRGLVRRVHQRDLPRHRPGVRARDAGPRRADGAASTSSSRSTTTRPPSCCSTAPAGRSPRRRPTTPSTRRWPATTPTPPSRRTTPTSRPSCTRPTARPPSTPTRRTAPWPSPPRWRPARPPPSRCPTTSGCPRTASSGFNFPDDEELVQAEFEKNIPFAIATAQSALDPDDPVSVVGRTAPDFVVDSFDVSYGRSADRRRHRPRVAGAAVDDLPHQRRPAQTLHVRPRVAGWRPLRREGEMYYGEFRGTVAGRRPGDTVQVQFYGPRPGRGPRAERAVHLHGGRPTAAPTCS